jgi:hypothetical protein
MKELGREKIRNIYKGLHYCEIPRSEGACGTHSEYIINWGRIKFVDYLYHVFNVEKSPHDTAYRLEIEFFDTVLLNWDYSITRNQTLGMYTFVQSDGIQHLRSVAGSCAVVAQNNATFGRIIEVTRESAEAIEVSPTTITIADSGKLFEDDAINISVFKEVGFRLLFVNNMAIIASSPNFRSENYENVRNSPVIMELFNIASSNNYNFANCQKQLREHLNRYYQEDLPKILMGLILMFAACFYKDLNAVNQIQFNPETFELKFPEYEVYKVNRQSCLAKPYSQIVQESGALLNGQDAPASPSASAPSGTPIMWQNLTLD